MRKAFVPRVHALPPGRGVLPIHLGVASSRERQRRGSNVAQPKANTILQCMDNLEDLGLVDDDDIVLDEAALTLALQDHAEIDVGPYEDVLSDIASRLDGVGVGAADASERAACLAQVLAAEFGFSGDAKTYDNPDNADLIRVIDRLRGLPISLSILYVAAARRIGWTAEILNLPGHVLVMVGDEAKPVIIDPFRGGAQVDAGEIIALLAPAKSGVTAAVRHVSAMKNRAILVRLLLNQATRAERAGDRRRALMLYRRMTSIAPEYSHPWWERARLELVDNDIAAARASLIAMLEITREPTLRERVTGILDALATA
ncbi:transglutaminase-like domain-containing protein [Sphingomonas sp. LR60]|uniref:transglutaminase-like domain-containing protein n=1 Tax=Sphingomonas sp. LR60 TaxID=3050233 RepID=UPI002FE331EB